MVVRIGIVGTGYVADNYMQSFATFPDVEIYGVTDIDKVRRERFGAYWGVSPVDDLDALTTLIGPGGLILNLTNPSAHFEVSRQCLEAGLNVYSEKPLALDLDDARRLCDLAAARGLLIAAAPCNFLGEAAQVLATAVRAEVAGRPRLVYAEIDDDFVSQAPHSLWTTRSGTPWPFEDEFQVGCTIEHAGYYLTWLVAMFGSVRNVVAASACLAPDRMRVANPAPDLSVAMLFFESGVVARLTCSILAPHNHTIVVVGDHGILEVDDCWDNSARVRFRRRFVFRRKLLTSPFSRRMKLRGETHPKTKRVGASSMNFALGPIDLVEAIEAGRKPRMSAELALHLTEVTMAIAGAGESAGIRTMSTRCPPIAPMPWALELKGASRWQMEQAVAANGEA